MIPPNTPSPVTYFTDIERARNLIPGFLKKTLSPDDREWMTQFLDNLNQQGGSVAAEFTQEIEWVERSQQQLAQDAPAFNAQAGWQRMQNRLDAPAPLAEQAQHIKAAPITTLTTLTTAISRVKSEIRTRIHGAAAWWRKPVVGVIASAMIVGQMGILAAVVKQMSQATTVVEGVTPSSGAPSLEGMQVLVIVFKDNASLLEVRTLIDSVQGRVIDGPGALGVWLVAVPKDQFEASLKRAGAAKAVESVAPQ